MSRIDVRYIREVTFLASNGFRVINYQQNLVGIILLL